MNAFKEKDRCYKIMKLCSLAHHSEHNLTPFMI